MHLEQKRRTIPPRYTMELALREAYILHTSIDHTYHTEIASSEPTIDESYSRDITIREVASDEFALLILSLLDWCQCIVYLGICLLFEKSRGHVL